MAPYQTKLGVDKLTLMVDLIPNAYKERTCLLHEET